MENGVFSALELHAHGFHEFLTHRLAVAGAHIYMFAPKATGAVVSVTTAFHDETALFASEVFSGALELPSRHANIHPIDYLNMQIQASFYDNSTPDSKNNGKGDCFFGLGDK